MELPDGRTLTTLREAADYITALPKKEAELPEWQVAIEALLLVSRGGPPSLSEQQSIASALKYRAREIEKLETVYQSKLFALKKLKHSILHKAFSGALTSPLPQAIDEAAE